MNQTTYKPICSVQVFHSYFEDTLMRAIEFTPTGHFKEIIGQMGIVLRLTIKLPNASANQIEIAKRDGAQWAISKVYIYI